MQYHRRPAAQSSCDRRRQLNDCINSNSTSTREKSDRSFRSGKAQVIQIVHVHVERFEPPKHSGQFLARKEVVGQAFLRPVQGKKRVGLDLPEIARLVFQAGNGQEKKGAWAGNPVDLAGNRLYGPADRMVDHLNRDDGIEWRKEGRSACG